MAYWSDVRGESQHCDIPLFDCSNAPSLYPPTALMNDLFPELQPTALPPIKDKYYVGTSGFVFPDWRGTVYPARLSDRELLPHYLNVFKFNTLEVNYTFYRMPTSKSMARFSERTPPDYQLAIKASREITHIKPEDVSNETFRAFYNALSPLREAGKLTAVLLQFPYSFHNTEANRDYLRCCRERLHDDPVVVEFRHDSWLVPEAESLLRDLHFSYCSVDEPRLKGLLPFHDAVTGPLGYVRLHGRNRAWFTAGEKERYNYDYTDRELADMLERIRAIAEQTRKTLVFFNNCYMGRAVKNAMRFRQLLGQSA